MSKSITPIVRVLAVSCVLLGAWVVYAEEKSEPAHRNIFEPWRVATNERATTAPATYEDSAGALTTQFMLRASARARERSRLDERRASVRATYTQTSSEHVGERYVRAGQYMIRMTKRMGGTLERLKRITDRVASRIEKTEARGIDMTTARATLDEVYPLMEQARTDIAFVGQVGASVLTSDEPHARTSELRDAALVARDGLAAIHVTLVDTVREVRSYDATPAVDPVPGAAVLAPIPTGTSSEPTS